MALAVGDPAPAFDLPDAEGSRFQLSALKGKWVVLYFYPRDNTPGCTKEACGFRDAYDQYQAADVVVLGVSADDAKAHSKFIAKHQLPFPLLIDEGGAVAETYGSYGLKKFMGKEFMGVFRHSFIIDPAGMVQKIYRKVKPEPHADEVLTDLAALRAESA
jgi:peroxiredoxin Q/BCP